MCVGGVRGVGVGAYFSSSGKGRAVRRGGRLFEAGCLLTFLPLGWVLIRGGR